MRAMVLHEQQRPLQLGELPRPSAGPAQLLLQVKACGICRADLRAADGELKDHALHLIPGHQIVGEVSKWAPE
jgi:alcohol dehydrogenase, propanol-preferring